MTNIRMRFAILFFLLHLHCRLVSTSIHLKLIVDRFCEKITIRTSIYATSWLVWRTLHGRMTWKCFFRLRLVVESDEKRFHFCSCSARREEKRRERGLAVRIIFSLSLVLSLFSRRTEMSSAILNGNRHADHSTVKVRNRKTFFTLLSIDNDNAFIHIDGRWTDNA